MELEISGGVIGWFGEVVSGLVSDLGVFRGIWEVICLRLYGGWLRCLPEVSWGWKRCLTQDLWMTRGRGDGGICCDGLDGGLGERFWG